MDSSSPSLASAAETLPQASSTSAGSKDSGPVRYFNRTFWIVLSISLLLHLSICQFFTFGELIPNSNDVNPCNLWKYQYIFPPQDSFSTLSWLGTPANAPSLNLFTFAADFPVWLFFTAYPPVIAAMALTCMYLVLKELAISPPAALFGAVAYAWQGDIIPFVLPGHFFYMALWVYLSLGMWGVLRALRTGYWPYAILSGLCCGWVVQSNPDRGALASLFIAAVYLSGALITLFNKETIKDRLKAFFLPLIQLTLCTLIAFTVAFSSLLWLDDDLIKGVTVLAPTSREQAFENSTQFRFGVTETLSLAAPGFFGWISLSAFPQDGSYPNPPPYWGENGRPVNYSKSVGPGGSNFNNAISTIGTIPSAFALVGIILFTLGGVTKILPLAKNPFTFRQIALGRTFLAIGLITLLLSWGANTPLYRILFELPFMDKWRNPLKWLECTTFCLCVLSSFGLHFFLLSFSYKKLRLMRLRNIIRVLYGLILLSLGVGLIASYPYGTFLSNFFPGKPEPFLYTLRFEPDQIENIKAGMHFALGFAFFLFAFCALALELLWHSHWPKKLEWPNPIINEAWQLSLTPRNLPSTFAMVGLAFTVIQLFWVDSHFVLPVKIHALTSSNPLLDALVRRGPLSRITVDTSDPLLRAYLQFQFSEFNIPCLEVQAASRIPDDYLDYGKALAHDQARYNYLSGASCLVVSQRIVAELARDPVYADNIDGHPEGFSIIPTESPEVPSHALLDLKHYMRKATYIQDAQFLPNQKTLIDRLGDPLWRPPTSVLFNIEDPTSPSSSPIQTQPTPLLSPQPHLSIIGYDPYHITVEIENALPGYILINDAFNKDWHATLDKVPVPVYRADILLRAIPIPYAAPLMYLNLRYDHQYQIFGRSVRSLYTNEFCDTCSLLLGGTVLFAILRKRRGRKLVISK